MKIQTEYFRLRQNMDDGYFAAKNAGNGGTAIADEFSCVDLVVNIATSGRPDLLERTLKSLGECELPAGYRETVIVENGGRGGAEDVVHGAPEWLNARYMHIARGNKSAALNAALETVGESLIFYTDDDVRLAPQALCAYADSAATRRDGCFFGGPMNVDYDAPPPEWLVEYLPCSATGWELDEDKQRIESAIFLGCNWAAFADDLRRAGGFNINFGPGSPIGCTGDETEMQDRLLKKGLQAIYVPTARVWHYVPEDRCTPAWAIERNFRNGLQDGARVGGSAGNPWGLPPWWVTQQYLRGILGEFRSFLSSDPRRRFRAKSRRSYDRGVMHAILHQNDTLKMRRAA